MMTSRLLLSLSIALATACAGTIAPSAAPGTAELVLSDDHAPAGYVELGQLSVQSGKGCGVFGTSGSRGEADAKLRAEAAKLGATFVRVTSVEEPRPNHQCMEHEYKLSGTAYGKPTASPAPVASSATPAVAPVAAPVAPDHAPSAASAMPASTVGQPPVHGTHAVQ